VSLSLVDDWKGFAFEVLVKNYFVDYRFKQVIKQYDLTVWVDFSVTGWDHRMSL